MGTRELSRKKVEEIGEIAREWGKLLAREACPGGPGLGMSLVEMEEIAAAASRGVVEGVVETMARDQAERWGEEAASGGRTGRRGRPRRAGGALLDVSSRFFSLSGRR
jgi:hypothetical protein